MKVLRNSLMVLLIFIMFTLSVSANSGPVYWEGTPSAGSMSVDKDTPIKVNKETLVFDFSDNIKGNWCPYGKVSARYLMENTKNQKNKVKMVFPIVTSFDELNEENEIGVMVGGKNIDYNLYIGKGLSRKVLMNTINQDDSNKYSFFSFENIVSSINKEPIDIGDYNKDTKCKLYKITFKTTEENAYAKIKTNFSKNDSLILCDGFNSYQGNDDGSIVMGRHLEKDMDEPVEVLVIGKDVKLDINAYEDMDGKKISDGFSYEIKNEEISLFNYLVSKDRYREDSNKGNNLFDSTQIYNMYAQSMNELELKVIYIDDILSSRSRQRIINIAYEVDFLPNSKEEITVSYKTKGAMDRRKTVEPLYTYNYLLNPANNWKEFKDLNIKIIPSDSDRYMINSTIDFEKSEDGIYTAEYKNLPKNDSTFTLASQPKEELKYKGVRNMSQNTINMILCIAIIVLVSIPLIILFIVNKKIKS